MVPDEGLGISRNLRLGETLAVGDMDGDGLCGWLPVIITTSLARVALMTAQFMAFAASLRGDTPGGLSPRPMLLMASDGDDNTGNFGRRLAMGDVTGDEKTKQL